MKKIILSILFLIIFDFNLILWGEELPTYNPYDYDVYTTDSSEVINDSNFWNDPLRQWTKGITSWIEWVAKPDINNSEEAKNNTLNFIKKIVDYFIWLLAVFSLIYLLYNFFIMLTAAGDDNKYKKWIDWIKLTVLVIVGIWLSWLLISFIFYLVEIMTSI